MSIGTIILIILVIALLGGFSRIGASSTPKGFQITAQDRGRAPRVRCRDPGL